MSIRLTALTVRQGDAFLLENDDRKCLFDSGWDQTVFELLKFKGIEKLDLAICSHNDADHAKGFIKLFELGFQITEIWLPGLWANVLRFVQEYCNTDEDIELDFENSDESFNGDIASLLSDDAVNIESFNHGLSFLKELENDEFMINRFCDRLHHKIVHNPAVVNAFLKSKWLQQSLENHLDSAFDDDFMDHCLLGAMSLDKQTKKTGYLMGALSFKLTNIILIASSALRHNCKIKWFEPSSACTKGKEIAYGFVSLNANEMCSIRRPKNSLAYMYLLKLTEENKHSLVFEFTKDSLPLIRFSADSDCTRQSVRPYPNNIIVTAPHHGSSANAVVYGMIEGDDLLWVRSDWRSHKRPCSEFKAQKKKYCLACDKYSFVSEICFEYNPGLKKWDYVNGEKCRCI